VSATGDQLPHLFVRGSTPSHPYGSRGRGPEKVFPDRDPAAHSRKLLNQVSQLKQDLALVARERKLASVDATADQVAFRLDANRGFDPKSLEDARLGI